MNIFKEKVVLEMRPESIAFIATIIGIFNKDKEEKIMEQLEDLEEGSTFQIKTEMSADLDILRALGTIKLKGEEATIADLKRTAVKIAESIKITTLSRSGNEKNSTTECSKQTLQEIINNSVY